MELLGGPIRLALFAIAAYIAYDIRLYAIRDFGRLIHEFDPWFNFHATRYLWEHGIAKFFTWFDHTVWYPLGRPVGTTIYPGMQLTSVAVWHLLQRIGMPMSLNDICVFVPCWFASIASVLTGFLATECSGIASAGPAAALIMAVIPAHLIRSMGGGYDNESIAVAAMVCTFWLWAKSTKTPASWPIAFLAAFAYMYMVAAWGGYVFVINTIAAHAGLLVLLGKFDLSTYKAFTIFYALGTLVAVQIPVVGWTPLKSLEQVMPLAVFLMYQVLFLYEVQCKRLGYARGSPEAIKLRNQVVVTLGGCVLGALFILMQTGMFAPLSGRVRGLFIKHMRTGNPLVDSVAEHQPTTSDAFAAHLSTMCLFGPIGWFMLFNKPNNAKIFLLMYSAFGYFFASKMNRLIILMGPIASALGGIALGAAADWMLSQRKLISESEAAPEGTAADASASGTEPASGAPSKKKAREAARKTSSSRPVGLTENFAALASAAQEAYRSPTGKGARLAGATVLLLFLPYSYYQFYNYGHIFAMRIANPSLVFHAQLANGQVVVVDDYLDSYNWLAANTPPDARVLSWWDYGYQISGIANRTTLADGNTWNHDHIALVGRCLTSEESRAHQLVRHLADYVLVWSGGGGDDLAKSPHMARIGNSVYPDICPNDPLCYSFAIDYATGKPTPTMAASMLYKMTENGKPGVSVNPELFREVYTSKYRKVRIYEVLKVSKKSRKWLADPANWKCDRPGSWYCPGQYPPDLPLKIRTGHKAVDYDKHSKVNAKAI